MLKNIIRVKKETRFVVLDKTFLDDNSLSWKAKGIMAYMLSKPDDWTFYLDELMRHSTDGKASFRSGFKELQDAGYVQRVKHRKEDGTFRWETIVYEQPHTDFPQVDNPSVEKPQVEKPSMDNRKLLNNDLLSNDELNNKELNKEQQLLQQDIKEIIEFWDNNGFGFNNINAKEKLLSWLDDSPFKEPKEMIIKALDIATTNDARRLNYVEGILRNWKNESLLTLEEVEKRDGLHRSRSNNASGNGKGTSYEQAIQEAELARKSFNR